MTTYRKALLIFRLLLVAMLISALVAFIYKFNPAAVIAVYAAGFFWGLVVGLSLGVEFDWDHPRKQGDG